MELVANVVLDVQLVQSNQCGGSYHMEKMGLEQSLCFLQQEMLEINTCYERVNLCAPFERP